MGVTIRDEKSQNIFNIYVDEQLDFLEGANQVTHEEQQIMRGLLEEHKNRLRRLMEALEKELNTIEYFIKEAYNEKIKTLSILTLALGILFLKAPPAMAGSLSRAIMRKLEMEMVFTLAQLKLLANGQKLK